MRLISLKLTEEEHELLTRAIDAGAGASQSDFLRAGMHLLLARCGYAWDSSQAQAWRLNSTRRRRSPAVKRRDDAAQAG